MVTPNFPSDESNAANVSRVTGNTATASADVTPSVDAQQTAETIRSIARRIREESIRMRELVHVIRQSGAVEELVDSFREASLATRDTAKEINDAARALRERGAIRETAVAIDETTKAAQQTAETVRVAAREVGEAAPLTSETVRKTGRRLRRSPRATTASASTESTATSLGEGTPTT
jgi:methyl-accepting chemotaxis protein